MSIHIQAGAERTLCGKRVTPNVRTHQNCDESTCHRCWASDDKRQREEYREWRREQMFGEAVRRAKNCGATSMHCRRSNASGWFLVLDGPKHLLGPGVIFFEDLEP